MQEGSVVYIDNQLFAYSHPDSSKYLRKTHLAADDDQGKYFPSVAEVEQVDDAKEDLKDDGRGGGDEVHCLAPEVVDVLGSAHHVLRLMQVLHRIRHAAFKRSQVSG